MRDRIPNKVAEYRKAKGLTQRDLADMTGMDVTSISKIENGKNIEIVTAQRIADALDTTTAILWPTKKKRG